MSIQAYVKKAGEGLQKKISENIEYAKSNPYPVEDLDKAVKSAGAASALAKIYGPSGEKAKPSTFPPDVVAAAMDEAKTTSPTLWSRLDKGQKGLNKLKSNETYLSKLDLEKELRQAYSQAISNMAGTDLTMDELLKSSPEDFGDFLLDLDIDTYGAGSLVQEAFKEIHTQANKEKTGSQINSEESTVKKTEGQAGAINQEKSKIKSESPAGETINDKSKKPAESPTVKGTSESVLSGKGEIVKAEGEKSEVKQPQIKINLEEKKPSEVKTETKSTETKIVEKPVVPEVKQPSSTAINSNTNIVNKTVGGPVKSEINSGPIVSTTNLKNDQKTTTLTSKPVEITKNTSIENTVNATSNKTSSSPKTTVSNKTTSSPINTVSNKTTSSPINTVSKTTQITTVPGSPGSPGVMTREMILEKILISTINLIKEGKFNNSTNNLKSTSDKEKSTINQNESVKTNTNNLVTNTLSQEKLVSNSTQTINSSEKVSQSLEKEKTLNNTAIESSLNNLQKISETNKSSDKSKSSENKVSTESKLATLEKTNTVVDRKNMTVSKPSIDKTDVQNTSTQTTVEGSNSSMSVTQNKTENSTSNTSQLTGESSPTGTQQVTNVGGTDLSQLAAAISRLEKILISGIDVTIKDH